MKKWLFILPLILISTGCAKQPVILNEEKPTLPEQSQIEKTLADKEETIIEKTEPTADAPAPAWPAEFNVKMDFQPQAPTGKWVMPYQEFCEEAVLILADKYFKQEKLSKSIMDSELLSLMDWEKANFNTFTDTSLAEVQIIAQQYFNLKAEISSDVSIENIKKLLSGGKLIIVPTAGRLLKNPYFSGKGPLYHYLLIKGYSAGQFITHDVGTWRGANFKYNFATVLDAVHDLPRDNSGMVRRLYDEKDVSDEQKASDILTGNKIMLIISGTAP